MSDNPESLRADALREKLLFDIEGRETEYSRWSVTRSSCDEIERRAGPWTWVRLTATCEGASWDETSEVGGDPYDLTWTRDWVGKGEPPQASEGLGAMDTWASLRLRCEEYGTGSRWGSHIGVQVVEVMPSGTVTLAWLAEESLDGRDPSTLRREVTGPTELVARAEDLDAAIQFATTLCSTRQWSEAEPRLEAASRWIRAHPEDSDPAELGWVLEHLGEAQTRLHLVAEAVETASAAVAEREREYSAQDPAIARAANVLGRALRAANDIDGARRAFYRAATIYRAVGLTEDADDSERALRALPGA